VPRRVRIRVGNGDRGPNLSWANTTRVMSEGLADEAGKSERTEAALSRI